METKKRGTNVRQLVVAALMLAIALVLPLVTGQIRQIGNMLLPMHFPVLLCGLLCGWQWGLVVGFIAPLLRSLMFGMPVFYPAALAMAFELATYGVVIGVIYAHVRRQRVGTVYLSMISAMIAGRLVWGAAEVVLLGLTGSRLTWEVFISGALLNAIPGIILQLIIIPAIMAALNRSGLVRFSSHEVRDPYTVPISVDT